MKFDVKTAIKAGDEYALTLSRLGVASEGIAKKAIRKGAGIVADQIRKNMEANIDDPESAAKSGGSIFKSVRNQRTGGLSESLGITPIKQDADGFWNAKIGFDGYDSKGVPNQLKARVMESGSSKIKPRPFVRPAVTATEAAAKEAMGQIIDEEIKEIMK